MVSIDVSNLNFIKGKHTFLKQVFEAYDKDFYFYFIFIEKENTIQT